LPAMATQLLAMKDLVLRELSEQTKAISPASCFIDIM
jgi:hypothetical protein